MTRTPSCGRPASRIYPTPALLGVGALLLCAGPTAAQTITVSSGTATVSGTGTSVVGGGTIFGGGASISTTNYATGQVGGNPNVGPYINLNVQDGGSIQNITVGNNGAANIAGGTVGNVTGNNVFISGGMVQTASTGFSFGQVIISGGTVQNADTGTGVTSISNRLTISGGTIGNVTTDRAGVQVTGGTVGFIGSDSFQSAQTGSISVSGGNVQKISTPSGVFISSGTVNTAASGSSSRITGGIIQSFSVSGGNDSVSGGAIASFTAGGSFANTVISGGSLQSITDSGFQDVINITGTGLQEIGMPTDANNDGTFQLLGTLSDGEVLNAQYTQSGTSNQLQFNGVKTIPSPVPEASTLVSLGGMLLLGGAGFAFRARKRAQA